MATETTNMVKFAAGTAAQYAASSKDANTLYFVSDERRIYKGPIPYTGGIYVVNNSETIADPQINTLYVNTTSGKVSFYDGSKMVTVVPETIDAYTKTETDTKIAEAIADAGHVSKEIVEALPAIGNAEDNVIYMVPEKDDDETVLYYREYMLVDSKFEEIGDTRIDLSPYYTKTETDTVINDAIEALDYTDAAVAGKYVSSVSQEDGVISVTREDLPAAPVITTGETNGTIKVGTTEVAVKGLDTAAYSKVEDFDEAGAADTAEENANAYTDEKVASALEWIDLSASE